MPNEVPIWQGLFYLGDGLYEENQWFARISFFKTHTIPYPCQIIRDDPLLNPDLLTSPCRIVGDSQDLGVQTAHLFAIFRRKVLGKSPGDLSEALQEAGDSATDALRNPSAWKLRAVPRAKIRQGGSHDFSVLWKI